MFTGASFPSLLATLCFHNTHLEGFSGHEGWRVSWGSWGDCDPGTPQSFWHRGVTESGVDGGVSFRLGLNWAKISDWDWGFISERADHLFYFWEILAIPLSYPLHSPWQQRVWLFHYRGASFYLCSGVSPLSAFPETLPVFSRLYSALPSNLRLSLPALTCWNLPTLKTNIHKCFFLGREVNLCFYLPV